MVNDSFVCENCKANKKRIREAIIEELNYVKTINYMSNVYDYINLRIKKIEGENNE